MISLKALNAKTGRLCPFLHACPCGPTHEEEPFNCVNHECERLWLQMKPFYTIAKDLAGYNNTALSLTLSFLRSEAMQELFGA